VNSLEDSNRILWWILIGFSGGFSGGLSGGFKYLVKFSLQGRASKYIASFGRGADDYSSNSSNSSIKVTLPAGSFAVPKILPGLMP
jgi:hypothetical protein